MRRIETRLARLEKKTPRPDAGPAFVSFDSVEAYQAAINAAQSRGLASGHGSPFVKVYIGIDGERV